MLGVKLIEGHIKIDALVASIDYLKIGQVAGLEKSHVKYSYFSEKIQYLQ